MGEANQVDPIEPEIEHEEFEYGVQGGSVPGSRLIDRHLEYVAGIYPTDSWVDFYHYDSEGKGKKQFSLPYYESKEDRLRFMRLLKQALDAEDDKD